MFYWSELSKSSTAHSILLLLSKSSVSSKTVPVYLGRATEYLHDLHSDDCLTVIQSINIKFHLTISLCLHVLYQWTHKLNFQLLIRPPPPALPVTQKNASEAVWSSVTMVNLVSFKQFLSSNTVLRHSTTVHNTVSQNCLERQNKLFTHFIH